MHANKRTDSFQVFLSHPNSRFDLIGESEPSSGCETIYWDSLLTFSDIGGPSLITESKYHIQNFKIKLPP